jgi:phosphoglycerate kinase
MDGSGVIATMDTVPLSGKRVLLRVDFNSPLDASKEKLLDDTRLRSHAATIRELMEIGARVTIVSHQGRPGMPDFSSLKPHQRVIENILGEKIDFVEDVIGPEARRKIVSLERGEALLLDNVRLLSEEMIEASGEFHAKSIMISRLYPLFDLFINDAFATSHRKHASIVGFPYRLPSLAGRVMEKELQALRDIRDPHLEPKIFVLGGAKLTDSIRIVRNILSRSSSSRVLLTGLVSELFMVARDMELGIANLKTLEKKGALSLVPQARELWYDYDGRIIVPIDFVTECDGTLVVKRASETECVIKDVGPETIEYYSKIYDNAKVIVIRGPAGIIEEGYVDGTVSLIDRAVESGAKVILGGGHLNSVASLLKHRNKIHNSTGGGALLLYLSGTPLPGIEALKDSASRFGLKGIKIE